MTEGSGAFGERDGLVRRQRPLDTLGVVFEPHLAIRGGSDTVRCRDRSIVGTRRDDMRGGSLRLFVSKRCCGQQTSGYIGRITPPNESDADRNSKPESDDLRC